MDRITIIKESYNGNSYHVVSDGFPPRCADHLTFDEMLGYVARLMCPIDADGEIPKYFGKPLFLERPVEQQK